MTRFIERYPFWALLILIVVAFALWLIFATWPPGLEQAIGRKKVFLNAFFNGITLGGLYFLVASGFTLIFGLMRNVNLAHGSLYLFGGYLGYTVSSATGSLLLAFVVAFVVVAAIGVLMQLLVFRFMEGQDLRQTMVTIGLSIVFADLMLWVFGGDFYQVATPAWLVGPVEMPFVTAVKSSGEPVYLLYPKVRLVILAGSVVIGVGMWLVLNRTRIGMIVRAGVDDRDILAAMGVRIQAVFVGVFAFGAGLAGLAGVVGGTFQSLAPGEDTRILLDSLVVVILGGMGSIPGAALGALIVGLSEQLGSVYIPSYAIVVTFLIMVLVLAVRPQGLVGGALAMALVQPSRSARAEAAAFDFGPPAPWIVAVVLILLPLVSNSFFLSEIFGQMLILGIIALSLMFLAGYGGMVSLMQLTVAGFAGYMYAIFGVTGTHNVSLGWPWWLATPVAVALAILFGTIGGALAVRTAGIYTIMITLALGAAFYYFTNQNYAIFNGHTGINTISTPAFWGVDWRASLPFYYLTLAVAAVCYFWVDYLARAPFGLALQGVRDNPRRMAALGFHVNAHRIAAYAFAAFLAALGGILQVWNYKQISPGSVGVDADINILIIAVVGGITRPVGPFIGAFIFVLLRTFALDFLSEIGLDGNRFRLLIGLGFLLIVFWSPDGVIGLWERWRGRHMRQRPREGGPHG